MGLRRYDGPLPIPDAPQPWQTRTEVFPDFYADGATLVQELGGRSRAVFDRLADAVEHAEALGWEWRMVGGAWSEPGLRPARPQEV